MSEPAVQYCQTSKHIIRFNKPRNTEGVARSPSEEIGAIYVDQGERNYIRDHSNSFRTILNVDRRNGKGESTFWDFRLRCTPPTTKMLVRMISTRNGNWPPELPRRGRQLVELYVAFQVFDCGFELLRRSDGFQEAANHLVFAQRLDEIAGLGEPARELHAIVADVQRYICFRLKGSLDQLFGHLRTSSEDFAERLQNRLGSDQIRRDLNNVGRQGTTGSSCTPHDIDCRLFGIIDEILQPQADELIFGGARGGNVGIAGALERCYEAIANRRPRHPVKTEEERLAQKYKPMRDFDRALRSAVGLIGEDASNRFRQALQRNWDQYEEAKASRAGPATDRRRDSAA